MDKGIAKLDRDLDIVKLLDIVKGYHVMKQVLFSQDDRFFLHLQRRDMIHSSGTDTDQETRQKAIRSEPRQAYDSMLNLNKSMDEDQKAEVRRILKRFEGRKLKTRELRIL